MGIYLNPLETNFKKSLNSDIYIDKSLLIEHTNNVINTEQQFICVSRPRRFGKSMAANMLTAYYNKGCNSKELFSGLKISKSSSFEKHLNKYNVIHLNMADFWNEANDIREMLNFIEEDLTEELIRTYSHVEFPKRKTLMKILMTIFNAEQVSFVFVIDEWDCIFRENQNNTEAQKVYLDFLRGLLKDKSYVALAYMTGILPIKKYGKHSALNMFTEISMTNAREFSEFTGFTEEEVKELCEKYNMSFEETKRWYDGYDLKGVSIYNPRSVVMSMTGHDYDNYWTKTETYEALKVYITMNYDGLKDAIVEMLSGKQIEIDTTTFTNDMVNFETKDDILTLLIHLGYLGFDFESSTVFIPNYEISEQYISTVRILGWNEIINSIKVSDELLNATLKMENEKVAEIVEKVHQENTSILQYNNENSLSCIISLAYYSARKSYVMHREMQAGKGYADIIFIPRKNNLNPAIIVELKWNKSVETAMEQIKEKNYPDCFKDYKGEVLLVGINYDKDSKEHNCKIEKVFI